MSKSHYEKTLILADHDGILSHLAKEVVGDSYEDFYQHPRMRVYQELLQHNPAQCGREL